MQIMCSISRSKDFALLKSRDSAVSVENRIQAGRPRSCYSNPVRCKRVLPSPKGPDRLWRQNTITVCTGSTLPRCEVFELWSWPRTPIEMVKLHSFAHMPSWCAKGQLSNAAEWCNKTKYLIDSTTLIMFLQVLRTSWWCGWRSVLQEYDTTSLSTPLLTFRMHFETSWINYQATQCHILEEGSRKLYLQETWSCY